MTTTNISPSSIVVEVLRDDNYDDWSACMKSYMLAQDLWDFIEPAGLQEVDYKALRRKNAAALHAIQVSCAPHMLSKHHFSQSCLGYSSQFAAPTFTKPQRAIC